MKLLWERTLDRLCKRVLSTRAAVGKKWPYYADSATGEWFCTDDGDWCSGHWIEMLRIVGERSGDRSLVQEAIDRTWLHSYKLERDDQFRSPQFYYSAARLYSAEKMPEMRELALKAAEAVRKMALPFNGGMQIGTQVQVLSTDVGAPNIVAVDNAFICLLLDWYAYKETQEQKYLMGAKRHLETTTRDFIRTNGSTNEFIEYDPLTRSPKRVFTLLGKADDSTWSRGQAWAIAGYLRAYNELGQIWYLDTAWHLLHYYLTHSREGYIPPWDFDDESPEAPIDTSASAIIASQLALLAVQRKEDPNVTPLIENYMEPIIDALCKHVTDGSDGRPEGMLLNGCFNYPKRFAWNNELIWGDFYLLEALYCLERGGLPC